MQEMKSYLNRMGIIWYPKTYHKILIGKFFDFINLFMITFIND